MNLRRCLAVGAVRGGTLRRVKGKSGDSVYIAPYRTEPGGAAGESDRAGANARILEPILDPTMDQYSESLQAVASDFRYKAFISYSWADKTWAAWLHRVLEAYRPPKGMNVAARPLCPIFKDREEEAAGASIGASIEAALGASEFLIVLCSPRAAASPWVNHEIAWFKIHRDPNKILALIVGGEPGSSQTPADAADACFPATLLHQVNADLLATEVLADAPLAADARAQGDGKRLAKLKIAAAMMRVGLDALVQRDDRRRAARRRLLLAGLMALSTVLAGLSIFAFNQRDAALHARNQAVASKQEAEFQRNEAQGLVEFMLTDLRQRLDAVGRLDVLGAVANRLNESYAKQDLATLDPDALGRRARVLLLLGEIDTTRGLLDPALAQYQRAAASTAELLRRDPDNQQRIFDHAQSVYWVGDIAWKRGDIATATEQWTQYRDFGARLAALDPHRDAWQTELGYGHRNLGVLAFNEGEAAVAVDAFNSARDVSARLANKHPEDANLKIILADDLMWLALAKEKQGAFADAEAALVAEATISQSLLDHNPTNDAALRRQSVNRRISARLVIEQGDARRALATLQDLVATHQARLEHDRENTLWLDLYGLLQVDIANVQLALGDVAAARSTAAAAIASARRLLELDNTVTDWRTTNLGGALLIAARTAITAGDLALAAEMGREAQTLIGGPDAEQKPRAVRRFAVATAAVQARLHLASGDRAGAERIARRAMVEMADLVLNSAPLMQHQFVEIYLLAGEAVKAMALAESLYALGYRHPDFMSLRATLVLPEGGGDDDTADSN